MKPAQIRGWIFKLYDLHKSICQKYKLPLKAPHLDICEMSPSVLGTWDKEKRLITISSTVLLEGSYELVQQVLKHEMAHQFVDEVLCRRDSAPHGELFKSACDLLEINSAASLSLDRKENKKVSKIEKLLALSTSKNQHEAEAALSKAQELSFKYNVTMTADVHREYSLRPIGEIRKRIPTFEWKIMNILSEYYFVKTLKTFHQEESAKGLLWQFEIYGTSHNIDTAEYVYYFLLNNGEQLWKQYRKDNGSKVSRMRNSFMNGLLDGFNHKLNKEQTSLKEKYEVKRIVNADLDDFFHLCNPRISRRKVSYSSGADVYSDGLNEGKSLKVNPGLKTQKGSRGLLIADKLSK